MKIGDHHSTRKNVLCLADQRPATMSEDTFKKDFLHLSAPIRYVLFIYGISWQGDGGRYSRWQSAIQLIWSILILVLDIVVHIYLVITKVTPHLMEYYARKEMPVSSFIAIIDRLSKMICVIFFHFLMLLTFKQTFKIFFDLMEPISKALDRPKLSNIRKFSNCIVLWLLFSVINLFPSRLG